MKALVKREAKQGLWLDDIPGPMAIGHEYVGHIEKIGYATYHRGHI